MALDFGALEKAINSLGMALDKSAQDLGDDIVRDAVIQRFEYTYELCWKMLKRKLERDAANPSLIDQLPYRDLIREGAVRGYIEHPEPWFEYRAARNITSHTYDEQKAIVVYRTAVQFVKDAAVLLKNLKG